MKHFPYCLFIFLTWVSEEESLRQTFLLSVGSAFLPPHHKTKPGPAPGGRGGQGLENVGLGLVSDGRGLLGALEAGPGLIRGVPPLSFLQLWSGWKWFCSLPFLCVGVQICLPICPSTRALVPGGLSCAGRRPHFLLELSLLLAARMKGYSMLGSVPWHSSHCLVESSPLSCFWNNDFKRHKCYINTLCIFFFFFCFVELLYGASLCKLIGNLLLPVSGHLSQHFH